MTDRRGARINPAQVAAAIKRGVRYWPNSCKCGLPMQFRFGPGGAAWRECAIGHKVTARDVTGPIKDNL
jgi:hypothetical protein